MVFEFRERRVEIVRKVEARISARRLRDLHAISSLAGRGPRGTCMLFVSVQIGTRRLGTVRSGLACQVARTSRIWDAPGFSQWHS